MKKLLHVGCGPQTKENSTKTFETSDWTEIRLDIDETIIPKPDIIASLTDLSMIDDKSFDAIYSSHNLEHLYPHEVDIALREFYRVIKDDGEIYIGVPDLQGVAKHVAEGNLTGTLYQSGMGPIAAIDILYGHRASLQDGKHYMAHKCGFTSKVLLGLLHGAGFKTGMAVSNGIDMWVNAIKPEYQQDFLKKNFNKHLGK